MHKSTVCDFSLLSISDLISIGIALHMDMLRNSGALCKADELHSRHIETIVQVARNENEKVSEIAFINSLEADLARREMSQRLQQGAILLTFF